MAQPIPAPSAEDERQHPPGPEPLWSESWYFDAVSPSGDLGFYARLGRMADQGCALYTAAIVRPGRPAILVVDPVAPLPTDEDQSVETSLFRAGHQCVEPLREFRVTLDGTGEAYADHAAPLRAERGEPVDVSVDLTWHTDGTPYAWRRSTRYEMPCRVHGTIRIGDEELVLAGPGQRDHSWGVRDWWAHEWMWSAFHLEDGTRVHAVCSLARNGMATGYVQRGDEMVELAAGGTTETWGADGLVTGATIDLPEAGLALTVRPLAHGALRMDAPDGRISRFPRASAAVTTQDGRSGVGWIEWNTVHPPEAGQQ